MWFFTILLGLSLFGLLFLFCLKIFEQKGRKVPLLPWLRAHGDAPVMTHTKKAVRFVAYDAHVLSAGWLAQVKTKLVEAEVAALSLTHKMTARIHERLLHRKRHLSNENTAVSAHLKDVLEYKKEASKEE